MKRKLLTGLIIVFVLAAAFFMVMLITGAAIAVWVYLVVMMRRNGTKIFHEQMAPELVKKRYKMLKTSLWVGVLSIAAGIVGVVVHNVVYGLTETEELVFFLIALSALWLFTIATGAGLFIYIRGRQKPA